MNRPTASALNQYLRTKLSLTTATCGESFPSWSEKYRPLRKGIFITSK